MPINYEAAKTLIKGLVQKMKSFRGNWEQNDPTADDYIKNRPFYTEGEKEVVIIPEMVVSISDYFTTVTYSPIIPFEVGKTYNVLWNGDSYSCVANELDGIPAIGDFKFSSLPFFIAVDEDIFGGAYIASSTDGDYTVLVTSSVEVVHKIDRKYIDIPDIMNATNPVGTGSFSMNRKAGTRIGDYSHAEGHNTTASGECSHAEGNATVASDPYSHAEGCNTSAIGLGSHAEGNDTTASGYYAHAEGFGNNEYFMYITGGAGATSYTVETNYPGMFPKLINKFVRYNGRIARVISISDESPYTISLDNTLSDNAVESGRAMMILTGIALGRASHAEGYGNNALGYASHAEGQHTEAIGDMSHSEGYVTDAAGEVSHAEGYNTRAAGQYQHVQGKYNVEDTEDKYAHIVGNGDYKAHSNAHTIDWNGLGWFAGGLKVGGTGQDDGAAVEVALKTDILSLDTTLSVEGSAADAKAVGDALNKSIIGLSVDGTTITYIKGDGSIHSFETQDTDTDTKVTQAAAITTYGEYPILLANSTTAAAVTNTVNKTSTLKYNPNTQILTAPTFKGDLNGNATSANKLNTNAGSATKPVYFANGIPVATSYTLGASIPSCTTYNNGQVLCVVNGVPAWQTINNVVPSAEGVDF